MTKRRQVATLLSVAALAFALAGCDALGLMARHPVLSEADAIATARPMVHGLREPITVTSVKSGTIFDIYDGAHPSFASEEDAKAWRARVDRPGWRVDFVGILDGSNPGCPGTLIPGATVQVVLDAETGEYVMGVSSQPPCPGM